jgi:hypothetical protein
MIGKRKERVFPDPVCDWINKSLDVISSDVESATGRAALWMDVGFETFILEDRCATIRGSKPRPWKVDESVNGALLGFEMLLETVFCTGASILGL